MAADSETRSNARAIYRILTRTYPEVRCELDFTNPLELTVAVVLSAQCTDKRVNSLTPALFKKYKKAKDYARAPLAEIEEYIFSAGFYHAKARHLKASEPNLLKISMEKFRPLLKSSLPCLVWEERPPTSYSDTHLVFQELLLIPTLAGCRDALLGQHRRIPSKLSMKSVHSSRRKNGRIFLNE